MQLTADTSEISDGNGPSTLTFSYQWERADDSSGMGLIEIGTDSATYTPVAADVGKFIRVTVTYTDDAQSDESISSAYSGPVIRNDATGRLRVSGPPVVGVGAQLMAILASVFDLDGLTSPNYSYQWQRLDANGENPMDIARATADTYTLTADDAGSKIRVKVTFMDDLGNDEELVSDAFPESTDTIVINSATGTLSVSGHTAVGGQLTATLANVQDEDGLTSPIYSYQWQRLDANGDNPTDIASATGETYTLTADDVGGKIRVMVTFMDDIGNEEALVSDAYPGSTGTIVINAATGTVSVSGEALVGRQLTAKLTHIRDLDGLISRTYRYQWQRLDPSGINPAEDIAGATTAFYTLAADDHGGKIRVQISFEDDLGNDEQLASDAFPGGTDVILALPTGMPVLVGDIREGETVTIDGSGVSDADEIDQSTLAFRLYIFPASTSSVTDPVTGTLLSTGPSFTLRTEDIGMKIIGVMEFDDNSGEQNTLLTELSLEVVPVNRDPSGTLSITGRIQVDTRATVEIAEIADPNGLTLPAAFTYQWQRADDASGAGQEDIGGGTSSTYRPVDADMDKFLRVVVGFTDDHRASETLVSEYVGPVAARPDNVLPTGAVTITGTAEVGGALTAEIVDIADSNGFDGESFHLQWERSDQGQDNWADVSDRTSTVYPVSSEDEGKALRMRLSFTDDDDYEEIIYSANTSLVSVLERHFSIVAQTGSESVVEPALEETARLSYEVTLDTASDQASTVSYYFGGTATEGADFMGQFSRTATFAAGETSQTITVSVTGDRIAETEDETVEIILVSPSPGIGLGTPSTAVSTITKRPNQIEVSATFMNVEYSRVEMETTVSFMISVSPAAPAAGSVAWRLMVPDPVDAGAGLERSAGPRAARDGTESFAEGISTAQIEVTFTGRWPVGESVEVHLQPFEVPGASVDSSVVALTSFNERQVLLGDWIVAAVESVPAVAHSPVLVHAVADFTRSVGVDIVGSIWNRANAHRSGAFQSHATLGGSEVDPQALADGDAGKAVREVAGLFGLKSASPDNWRNRVSHDHVHGASFDDYREWAGVPDLDAITGNSSFALSHNTGIADNPAVFWGKIGDVSYKSEFDPGSSVDGTTTIGHLGIDSLDSRGVLLGIAVNRVSGETQYVDGETGGDASSFTAHVTGIYPYFHALTDSGMGYWGSLGAGIGVLKVENDANYDGKVVTDLNIKVFAIGMHTGYLDFGSRKYSLKSDAFTVGSTAQPAEKGFQKQQTSSSRIRAALESSGVWAFGGNQSLYNNIELGMRGDLEDGVTGFGMDLAGDLRYVNPKLGLEVAGNLGMLLLHEKSGYKEMSTGFTIVYDPDVRDRGVHVSLQPTWNAPRSGVAESMWNLQNYDGYAPSDSSMAVKTRLGYGSGALWDWALATVYGESETGSELQRLRLGTELEGLERLSTLRLGAYGERTEKEAATSSDAIMLEARIGL